jgi:hypothetical protein
LHEKIASAKHSFHGSNPIPVDRCHVQRSLSSSFSSTRHTSSNIVSPVKTISQKNQLITPDQLSLNDILDLSTPSSEPAIRRKLEAICKKRLPKLLKRVPENLKNYKIPKIQIHQKIVKSGMVPSKDGLIMCDKDLDELKNITSQQLRTGSKSQETSVAVDEIRIGRFPCKRAQFSNPSVQFCDSHFSLHVWEKRVSDADEKEIKVCFEIQIKYCSLTYAAFSKTNKFCFCVFVMSSKPKWNLDPAHSTDSNLLGKYRHDSENIQESSIIITSKQCRPIQKIRKLFIKYCPDVMSVLLDKESRKLKPKAYLTAHGLRQKSLRKKCPDGYKAIGTSKILVYPTHENDGVTLTINDISRLKPGV